MKPGKSDSLFSYSSDLLLNGPQELIDHLVNLIRSIFVHGEVPHFLLLCTLVPLVKNNLADIASSENYRAIAISSLILKLLDWIILLLESDKLSVDQLSFGYQKCTSTVMCSFAMTNVIEHYNNKGQEVYGFSGDISKGFDVLDWLPLFTELLNRKISKIFLRVMIFIYVHQYYDVRWNGSFSDRFGVSNGIRQGGISSPIFWNLYLDSLITRIRKLGLGCHVAGTLLGIFIYADDIFLLCPSRPGLQAMVKECEQFAKTNNLIFSTDGNPIKSKTKCIIFDKKPIDTTEVTKIILDDKKLPWVPSLKHLGMTLE